MDLNALTTQIDREHDACGIFSRIEKSGVPSHKTVQIGLQSLKAMRHRAGYVQGEGDGCGLLLDIPKLLWRRFLAENGLDSELVEDRRFFVAHLFLQRAESDTWLRRGIEVIEAHGADVLMTQVGNVKIEALGPSARRENPVFVQLAGLVDTPEDANLNKMMVILEQQAGIHVASISRTTVVYKVVGDGETLANYYPDLLDPFYTSSYMLGHTRYSTNTTTSFSRVQPFALLGHNGEINTISRFYTEASMLGLSLDSTFSDSQMVDGALHHFVSTMGWSLFEAAELVFPPILHEIKQIPKDLSDMYMFFRSLWGPFAQGPAAMMMRYGKEAVYSVDALGLRPMWLVETDDSYCFSSEQGVVASSQWVSEPKPLSPGEKIGVRWLGDGRGTQLYTYSELQSEVHARAVKRYSFSGEGKSIRFAGPYPMGETVRHIHRDGKSLAVRQTAFGWREEDLRLLEFEIQTGAEPIRSLGYDGPLPALDSKLRLIPDFLQETVAVVTNPAIDREREIEHFSTRTVLGKRPSFSGLYHDSPRVEIQAPLLLEELPPYLEIGREEVQTLAHRNGTLIYEDALAQLHTNVHGTVEILLHRTEEETVAEALERFAQEALEAVHAGANVITLDDRLQFIRGKHIDPFLAIAAVHKALLRPASSQGGEHLRRRSSLVLRTAGIRNLHDVVVALGLGADAVNPYLMWEIAANKGNLQALGNLYAALCKGIEKVLSTIGIHELRGYERLFGAIGLANEVAAIIGTPNFCGNDGVGYSFAEMEKEADARQVLFDIEEEKKLPRVRGFQLYPRIWKAAGQVASGEIEYQEFFERLDKFEKENPINLKHALSFRFSEENNELQDEDIDTSIDGHTYPLVISSMSFGSQGETPYRAYAEAAYQMNIVALNGEGGEIKDILDKYPRNRGRQVASGRFGVNAELCNGAYVLEIKIGQGAKPGEGGHLPGSKVTVQVANARNASPGVDLISPSNNHDIYSIEDLAQVIHELRTINPLAKIAVKVPVVPNIGTIAVGIAKAGADVITLSGFDGGTGAARAHAIRHVGLPSDLGVKLAHKALVESGLRNNVEIWADGGMKSGADAMKAILLGANRVGFGTMAMVAIGCTSCRACHKDTCHVGIATQMTSMEEAKEKGLTAFTPREFELAVDYLTRFFSSIGEHIRTLTRQLGAIRTQDLVGRSDLLEQLQYHDRIDLSSLTRFETSFVGQGTCIEYRSWEEEVATVKSEVLPMAVGTTNVATGSNSSAGSGSQNLRLAPGSYGSEPMLLEVPRALGTKESGEQVRNRMTGTAKTVYKYPFVAGNGFAAYHTVGMVSVAEGGAQDGVGKGAYGGRIVVLKQRGADGRWHGGSVGKGLAYGAQRGLFIIQGNADARAGIRLSGADIVIGGEVEQPVQDHLGYIGSRSNMKGFAFEYMTAGRALVMGDPGPWICSGMTGGSVYVRHDPSVGLTEEALRRRVAKGAKVAIRYLDAEGETDVVELLLAYHKELRRSGQLEEAERLLPMIKRPNEHFLMIRPGHDLTDQTIATE